ncbi:hypothetical protein I4F81_010193 [Pyropia yezoensis]|uniref:Uncharacterized protein n=1 Tax=Pyropia yezoensis TaxID=2788 RepID=A0ACC3CCY8_PYRYE|nr:hypothetical protein I4F81_010193 [Neopyropia yezoensis]
MAAFPTRRHSLTATAAAAAAAAVVAVWLGATPPAPAAAITVAINASAPAWRHHPLLAAHPAARPVLVAAFWYPRGARTRPRRTTAGVAYVPGGGGALAAALTGWDTLSLPVVGRRRPAAAAWLALTLRRPAVVCGVAAPVGAAPRSRRRRPWRGASLEGWPGTPVAAPAGTGLPAAAIWCRTLPAGVSRLPSPRSVRLPDGRRVSALTLALAEAGGKVPTHDADLAATMGADPGGACPAALHDEWTVEVDGRDYATYHPAWDPLFHCSYGHEHGSAPYPTGRLPAFDYTAYKNDHEDESHPGFKFYRFAPSPGVLALLSLHFDANRMSRVLKRFHTVSLTVVREAPSRGAPPELLMDVSYKGDFGFAFTTGQRPAAEAGAKPTKYMLPLGAEEAALRRELHGVSRFRKRFNVANATDGRLERGLSQPLPRLRTEHWRGGTGPCSTLGDKRSGFSIDMADPPVTPSTVDRVSTDAGVALPLAGHPAAGTGGAPFLALRRALAFDGTVTVGAAHCPGGPAAGVFYTDPFGRRRVDGPCAGTINTCISVFLSCDLFAHKYIVFDS